MGEALYRRYRPQSLSDVVGQPHITTTLSNAIKNGRLSHAYLLTGPRGVGKTSVARILAHEVNGFPYADASGALDIIEIDAASNRRIDEIRDLRDKVHIAPVTGKYKIYIIDEVHMLTREAFNALLKTLEEPPAHVIFILATTEAHKLPETIVSRTQRFTFKPVEQTQVVDHLKQLAKKEKITISDEALKLVADHGEGSFRDSISLLDQLSLASDITEDNVRHLLGIPPESVIENIIAQLQQGDVRAIVATLESASDNGYSAPQIAASLNNHLRTELINGNNLLGAATLPLVEKLLDVPASSQPAQYLEIQLVGQALAVKPIPQAVPAAAPSKKVEKKTEAPKPTPAEKTESAPTPAKAEPTPKPAAPVPTVSVGSAQLEELLRDGLWDNVLSVIKKRYNTLYGVMRMAEPSIEDDSMVLVVGFAFHQKRLSEPKNAEIIASTIQDITGTIIPFRVEAKNTKKTTAKSNDQANKPDTLQSVNDIFGGGEVIEE